jgi:hypothetical protein
MVMFGTEFAGADHYFINVIKDGKETVLMSGENSGLFFFKNLN